MQGCASNFESALESFTQELRRGALFVAVDMELTGTSLPLEPDCYEESTLERFNKMCRIAEQHAPIQMGFTVVSPAPKGLRCASFNFYAFPWSGPELLGVQPHFQCQASALLFNSKHDVDFNAWIKEGVPFMTREDEGRYLNSPISQGDGDLPRKVGLLRLWKALCDAKVPLVVHGALDIFFLLACFEQRKLSTSPPCEVAGLVQNLFPFVYDTAYLHEHIGSFNHLALEQYLEEAKARHEKQVEQGIAQPCSFELEDETAFRYGKMNIKNRAHEAGYDSLLTSKLFAYLLAMQPGILCKATNRLFLYRSVTYLDLSMISVGSEEPLCLFDLANEALVVAVISGDFRLTNGLMEWRLDRQTHQALTKRGIRYKWMDAGHLLVIMNKADMDATQAIATLPATLPNISCWLPFFAWCAEHRHRRGLVSSHSLEPSSIESPMQELDISSQGVGNCLPACCKSRKQWTQDGRYRGIVKAFNPSQGFGFIACAETFAAFGRDVFVPHNQIGKRVVGSVVCFAVVTNSKGQPQAQDLEDCGVEDCCETTIQSTPSSARGSVDSIQDTMSNADSFHVGSYQQL